MFGRKARKIKSLQRAIDDNVRKIANLESSVRVEQVTAASMRSQRDSYISTLDEAYKTQTELRQQLADEKKKNITKVTQPTIEGFADLNTKEKFSLTVDGVLTKQKFENIRNQIYHYQSQIKDPEIKKAETTELPKNKAVNGSKDHSDPFGYSTSQMPSTGISGARI